MLTTKPPKPKTCAYCGTKFTPARHLMTAKACSPFCAQIIGRAKADKARKAAQVRDKRETRAKLDKLKSRQQWAKEAQDAVNKFVRLRDADQPCISCGRHHQGQYHAGHYLSVGARPELRYETLNIHKQCSACNNHLSGNVVLYRMALLEKIGAEAVAWLEGPHEAKHYSVDDLKAIKQEYSEKARELQKVAA